MKIRELLSVFSRQIADLNQLFRLKETKMVMYIITLLSNLTFGKIGKATVINMTAKGVAGTQAFVLALECGHVRLYGQDTRPLKRNTTV